MATRRQLGVRCPGPRDHTNTTVNGQSRRRGREYKVDVSPARDLAMSNRSDDDVKGPRGFTQAGMTGWRMK